MPWPALRWGLGEERRNERKDKKGITLEELRKREGGRIMRTFEKKKINESIYPVGAAILQKSSSQSPACASDPRGHRMPLCWV